MKTKSIIIIALLIFFAGSCTASETNINLEDSAVSNTQQDQDSQEAQGVIQEQTASSSVLTEQHGKLVTAPTQSDVDVLRKSASVVIRTNKGDITIELLIQRAPFTAANFLNLVKADFYDGVKFHRVIPDFMIQTGDPNSKDDDWSDDGFGGPGYQFADETYADDMLVRGTVAMANGGKDTNGSQFFIVTAQETQWLNGMHTIFGTVTEGMDVVEDISRTSRNESDHPQEDIIIEDIVIRQ